MPRIRNSFVVEVLGTQPSNTVLQPPDPRQSRRLAGLPPLPLVVGMSRGEEGTRNVPVPAAAAPALVTAAPSVPASAAAGPWQRQQLIEPCTFGGKSGEDMDEWLTHYKRVGNYYHWDVTAQLSNVVFFLTDTALVWFDNHEDTLATWDRFVSEITECFGDLVAKWKQAEQTLLQRAQVPGEMCTMFIEAILKLCKTVNARMPEEDKVGHLLKGIAKDVYHFLIGKQNLGTVADVVRHCRTFETLKMRRITPKFGQLPNVTTVASVDNCTASVLASTLCKILREELTRHLHSTPYAAAPIPVPSRHVSIAATGVEDCNYTSCSPLRPQRNHYQEPRYEHRYSYPPQPATTHQEPRENAFVPQRHSDAFQEYNAYSQPPVCYCCGATSHIARFCCRRRETSRYDPSSTFPRNGSARNNDPWSTYSRSTSRPENRRNSSPASDHSLTPTSTRLRRLPSL